MNSHSLLVFTDMDGSLLDHYTYCHAAADALLAELERQNIPVIANTSKTRAELEKLRKDLNNQHPFIAENGAAVFLPKRLFTKRPEGTTSDSDYWIKEFSKPRAHWQELIRELEPEFQNQFVTFAQAGVDGIVEMTGLDRASAALAAIREYGEPVRWLGTDDQKQEFFSLLETRGAQVLHGGRFSHVSGECDKGAALRWLKGCYENFFHRGNPLIAVGLGDSQNDIAMLDAADYAVIIKSPTHSAPSLHTHTDKLNQKRPYTTTGFGPTGWVEGMQYVLNKLETGS